MKRITQGALAATALVATTATLVMAQDAFRTYYADDPVGRNVVMIESRAPIETILTRTSQVTGEIHLNPANVLENPQARFELDTASLDNGIALRNEHMRGAMWLDTAKYPKATFTLTRIMRPGIAGAVTSLANITGKPLSFDAEGTLELHGATHAVQTKIEVMPIAGGPSTARRLPGDLLHVRATFPIKLEDYGIKVPDMAKLEVANEQQVTADIFSSTELPKPPQP